MDVTGTSGSGRGGGWTFVDTARRHGKKDLSSVPVGEGWTGGRPFSSSRCLPSRHRNHSRNVPRPGGPDTVGPTLTGTSVYLPGHPLRLRVFYPVPTGTVPGSSSVGADDP